MLPVASSVRSMPRSRPQVVPGLGSVRDEMSIGRSRYDGMNVSYRQRGFHKTDLTMNYTLARAVGYNEDGGSFRYYPRDPLHPLSASEFGPSFNDERHHLTIAGNRSPALGLGVLSDPSGWLGTPLRSRSRSTTC